MLRRAALLLVSCAFSSGCSLTWSHSRIESSVQLAAGAATTLRVHTVPAEPVTLVLRGQGPGAMAFAARTASGDVMARGALGSGDTAKCHCSDGVIAVEFTGPADGSRVDYELRSSAGLSIALEPRTP